MDQKKQSDQNHRIVWEQRGQQRGWVSGRTCLLSLNIRFPRAKRVKISPGLGGLFQELEGGLNHGALKSGRFVRVNNPCVFGVRANLRIQYPRLVPFVSLFLFRRDGQNASSLKGRLSRGRRKSIPLHPDNFMSFCSRSLILTLLRVPRGPIEKIQGFEDEIPIRTIPETPRT